MAHFAQLGSDDKTVMQVIRVENAVLGDAELPESEILGQAYIADVLSLDGTWLQTFYSGNPRSYCGPGWEWDGNDFIDPNEPVASGN